MSELNRPRAVPTGPQGQQPAGEQEPDFMAYAADQLRRAHLGATKLAQGADGGEGNEKVVALRIQIAQGYIALADIQYSIPEDDGGDLDEDYEEDEPDSRRR